MEARRSIVDVSSWGGKWHGIGTHSLTFSGPSWYHSTPLKKACCKTRNFIITEIEILTFTLCLRTIHQDITRYFQRDRIVWINLELRSIWNMKQFKQPMYVVNWKKKCVNPVNRAQILVMIFSSTCPILFTSNIILVTRALLHLAHQDFQVRRKHSP